VILADWGWRAYASRLENRIPPPHVALWFVAIRHSCSGLLFSHPIPLGIRYETGFMVLLMSLAIGYAVWGIWFDCLFHMILMTLGIGELAEEWGIALRDQGGSWDIGIVLDYLR